MLSAATMSSTQSAPINRASQTSFNDTVKSLRKTGRSIAARALCKSETEPPKKCSSVKTDKQLAPPNEYWVATSDATRSGFNAPREGDRRLISAITASFVVDSRRSCDSNPRARGKAATSLISDFKLRSSSLANSRCCASISSRYKN